MLLRRIRELFKIYIIYHIHIRRNDIDGGEKNKINLLVVVLLNKKELI